MRSRSDRVPVITVSDQTSQTGSLELISFCVSFLFVSFWATVCKTVRTMLSGSCPDCPVCDIGVLWPNGWMDQDETWHAGRPRPRTHCVRWGPAHLPQKGHSPCQPMSVVAKRLVGLRCHLVRRQNSAQATLFRWGPRSLPKGGGTQHAAPTMAHVLWPNGCMDQDAT